MSGQVVDTVGLDADDTLWHCEQLFVDIASRLEEMMRRHVPDVDLHDRLIEVERRNVAFFGYGIKGFTLSMIETAIEVSEQRVTAEEIHTIVGWSKEMLTHPVELLPGVHETVEALAGQYQLVLITKGDLWNQESKLAASGLADHFAAVEIVAEKDTATYARLAERNGIDFSRFVMVGNSLRSDVEPVLALGGRAVYIPYRITWALEASSGSATDGMVDWVTLKNIGELPGWLASL